MLSSDQDEVAYLKGISDRISEMKDRDETDHSDSQSDSSQSTKSGSTRGLARRANALRIEAPDFTIHKPKKRVHVLKAHPDDDITAWLAEQHRVHSLADLLKAPGRRVALSLEYLEGEARKIGEQLFDSFGRTPKDISTWDEYVDKLKQRLGPQDALVHAVDGGSKTRSHSVM
jgi:hypothetical protein